MKSIILVLISFFAISSFAADKKEKKDDTKNVDIDLVHEEDSLIIAQDIRNFLIVEKDIIVELIEVLKDLQESHQNKEQAKLYNNGLFAAGGAAGTYLTSDVIKGIVKNFKAVNSGQVNPVSNLDIETDERASLKNRMQSGVGKIFYGTNRLAVSRVSAVGATIAGLFFYEEVQDNEKQREIEWTRSLVNYQREFNKLSGSNNYSLDKKAQIAGHIYAFNFESAIEASEDYLKKIDETLKTISESSLVQMEENERNRKLFQLFSDWRIGLE